MGNEPAKQNMLEDKGSFAGGLFLLPVLSLLLGSAILVASQKEIPAALYFSAAFLFVASYLWDLKGLVIAVLISGTFLFWNNFSWSSSLFWVLCVNSALLFVLLQRRSIDYYRSYKEEVEALTNDCKRLEEEKRKQEIVLQGKEALEAKMVELHAELIDVKEELIFTDHQLQSFEKENIESSLEEDLSQKALLASLQESVKECQALEEEVKLLEEIVKEVFIKQKPKVPRVKKHKKEPDQGFLEFFLK